MNVPFVDLKTQYNNLKAEIDSSIHAVVKETAFVRGRFVEEFENAYAHKYGVKHCISCGNGTDALYIALKSLGICHGDEVITVANSWISTSETISQAGARPVFIDIEQDYFNIDCEKIEEKITQHTKAIVPVHLYGQPAKIDKIKKLCEKYDLFLIEDCAQAHFAEYNGQKVGTFGIAGAFSFYPGKNLGAYGDAGAIITNDDDFAIRARKFANHGSLHKHHHEMEGINSRLDGIQASVLKVKLKYIDDWNSTRLKHALRYNELLSGLPEIKIPKIRENSFHVFHLYVIRTNKRDELKDYLKSKEIGVGIHYPSALPFLPAYKYLGHKPSDFPVSHQYQSEILSLPMFPELANDQINYIVNSINEFFK